jgi:hypothetical protein
VSGANDFDLFRTSEFHEELRAAVQEVVKDKIAPYAADVDEEARYPQEAHDALVASDFFAPHVPEEYGGVGADALAVCIVIEEVARVCASSLAHPGGQQARLDAAHDRRERGAQAPYLTPMAEGEAGFCYGLSEREAGSDTAGMTCRAKRRRPTALDPQRPEGVDHQRRRLEFYTVLAVTDPDGRAAPTSRPSSSRSPTRASPSARRSASSASRAARPASCTSTTAPSPATG